MYTLNLIECLTAHSVSLTSASRFRDGKSPHNIRANPTGSFCGLAVRVGVFHCFCYDLVNVLDRQILGRIKVRVDRIATGYATEMRLIGAILSVDISATATPLGCVLGIDLDDRDPVFLRLVLNLGLHIKIRPMAK